jgi:hypothetical protein
MNPVPVEQPFIPLLLVPTLKLVCRPSAFPVQVMKRLPSRHRGIAAEKNVGQRGRHKTLPLKAEKNRKR